MIDISNKLIIDFLILFERKNKWKIAKNPTQTNLYYIIRTK